MDFFKRNGKTNAEIRDIENIVGYCCNCRSGFVAKYMPGFWINQNKTTEKGEIIGCQTGTRTGPFGNIDPIFNTIWIL